MFSCCFNDLQSLPACPCDIDATRKRQNMPLTDELPEHDKIELLARARDAWERAPQGTMRAAFEWRGKNYIVSHSSAQLRIHTDEGIKVC